MKERGSDSSSGVGAVSGFMGCDAERCPTVHNLQNLARSVILGCSPSSAVTSFCPVSALFLPLVGFLLSDLVLPFFF